METSNVRNRLGCRVFPGTLVFAVSFMVSQLAFSATINVSNPNQLRNAMKDANNGDVIVVAPGTYAIQSNIPVSSTDGKKIFDPVYFIGNVNNVTIKAQNSSNKPLLKGGGVGAGEYIFYAQKAHGLKLQNLRFSDGNKGVIIDRSNDIVIEGCEIKNTEEEALHIRDGSANGIIRNNRIELAGITNTPRGEGIYIGSDRKKWHPSRYDGSKEFFEPACDNVLIENNIIGPNIGAEGIDVKEGTTGVIIRNNTFNLRDNDSRFANRTGNSAVDVKGYKTVVVGNTFNVNGNDSILSAIEVFRQIDQNDSPNTGWQKWGYAGFFTNNVMTGDDASTHVVRINSDGGATVGCNQNDSGDAHKIGRKAEDFSSIISGSACDAYPSSGGGSSTSSSNSSSSNSSSSSSSSSSSNSSSSSSGSGSGSCTSVNFGDRAEIDLRSSTCVTFSRSLSGKRLAVWDSDTNTSCNFRGTVSSVDGNGSLVIDSNYEKAENFSGSTIDLNASNNCKFVKVRAY